MVQDHDDERLHSRVNEQSWPRFRGRFWQRNYYEHIIRNEESLNRIRQYIIENPMRWACERENPEGLPDGKEEAFWRQYS
jgi:REP-associated tyrosine transposase